MCRYDYKLDNSLLLSTSSIKFQRFILYFPFYLKAEYIATINAETLELQECGMYIFKVAIYNNILTTVRDIGMRGNYRETCT